MSPEEKKVIDGNFSSLEIFAWCITCETLLLGAKKHNSYWGKKVTPTAQLHRKGQSPPHVVYIGPTMH